MGRKHTVKSFKMLDSADISGNQTSTTTNVLQSDIASIALEWTGTSPVGTLTVEARNGEKANFLELDFGSTISISGNTGDHIINLLEMPFTDIRLQYTAGSGTGNMTATLTMKSIGA